ncbi:MAG TPA: BlaI/MecI/CopY family transcriptional regulator [Egibacteraceae bacterium]|nr:BlaI/MecI/CopY family transcriptional regulator [Egibacteraceae bacterium]
MAPERRSPALGPLESKIMRVMWDSSDDFLQVRDVLALLGSGLAYTTVMTVMNRLHEKGLLRRRKDGRAWAYRPALSREAYAAATMADALSVAGDRTAALLHFVADLNRQEAESLRRLLDASGQP